MLNFLYLVNWHYRSYGKGINLSCSDHSSPEEITTAYKLRNQPFLIRIQSQEISNTMIHHGLFRFINVTPFRQLWKDWDFTPVQVRIYIRISNVIRTLTTNTTYLERRKHMLYWQWLVFETTPCGVWVITKKIGGVPATGHSRIIVQELLCEPEVGEDDWRVFEP